MAPLRELDDSSSDGEVEDEVQREVEEEDDDDGDQATSSDDDDDDDDDQDDDDEDDDDEDDEEEEEGTNAESVSSAATGPNRVKKMRIKLSLKLPKPKPALNNNKKNQLPPPLSNSAATSARSSPSSSAAAAAGGQPQQEQAGSNSDKKMAAPSPASSASRASLPKAKSIINNKAKSIINNKKVILEKPKAKEVAAGSSSNGAGGNGGKPPKPPKSVRKFKLPMNVSRSETAMDLDDEDDEEEEEEDGELKATVVDSDEGGDDEAVAVAAVVSGAAASYPSLQLQDKKHASGGGTTSSRATTAGGASVAPSPAATKRRSTNPSRPMRLPPISSPGLLILPSSSTAAATVSSGALAGGVFGSGGGAAAAGQKPLLENNGYVTASSVFDHHMAAAGYTLENRTNRPHRGSSVRREVGDMFDTNIKLSLQFPPLVPETFLKSRKDDAGKKSADGSKDKQEADRPAEAGGGGKIKVKSKRSRPLSRQLLDSMKKYASNPSKNFNASAISAVSMGDGLPSRKRRRPWEFSDMVPVTLTIPYPETYIEKRLEYVKKVDEREKAIVECQEAEEDSEDFGAGVSEVENGEKAGEDKGKVKARIPPIPKPPSPPTIKELAGFQSDQYEDGAHPLYPPKNRRDFVAHVDKGCFHVADGRYFGMASNFVADPNFVGANAPGIAGLSASGGSGLATSTSGTGSSGGGVAMTLSTTYQGAALAAASAAASSAGAAGTSSSAIKNGSASGVGGGKSGNKKARAGSVLEEAPPSPAKGTSKGPRPKPTASALSLRKIMDEGGTAAENMKNCIISAAVYASRTGHHGLPFYAPNGETYPDVSKAFAAHANIKPCQRCKNNKQGAYHCRLRRRHKEIDHDGGDSPGILAPLFSAPLESLIVEPS